MGEANCCLILIIFAAIFILAAIALSIVVIRNSNKHRRKLEELTLYQIHTASTIDQSIPEILDLIIKESFIDYQVKYLALDVEAYINEEKEKEIRTGLVQMVTQRISNAALDKISLFYNIANIADIIADKIYILVMNYVVDHNSKFSDEGNKKA